MWNEGWDQRAPLLDDLLIEADLRGELETCSFWEGYREDAVPVEDRVYEDEIDWAQAA